MPFFGSTGIRPRDVWDVMHFNFYDEFTRAGADADVWIEALDDVSSFTPRTGAPVPSSWSLRAGNVIDADASIVGGKHNRHFSIEDDWAMLIWETQLKFMNTSLISAMWGLLSFPITEYSEPLADCAHFIADPAITNTFRVRTYEAAEEETDTFVVLDTDWHKFKMVWTAVSVLFYIDDVLVATHAAQVPLNALINEFLLRTEASSSKYMELDYLRVECF